jgi:hypothetical protein
VTEPGDGGTGEADGGTGEADELLRRHVRTRVATAVLLLIPLLLVFVALLGDLQRIARLDEDAAAAPASVVIGIMLVLVASGAIVWAAVRAVARARALRALLAADRWTPLAYRMVDGAVLLRRLEAPPEAPADLAVRLLPGYTGALARMSLPRQPGIAAVYGDPAPGNLVVPVVGDQPLWPTAPAEPGKPLEDKAFPPPPGTWAA